MTDLERRVRRALRGLPGSSEERRGRARAAALDALPGGRSPRRPRWLMVAAAVAAAVIAAGAALAATDRLDVRIGPPPEERAGGPPAPAPGRVVVPPGGRGLAVVAGGRLWLGTRSGLGVQGLAATTAELSPGALFVAVGIGRSLVAMTPDGGRRAWSHPLPGPVVAAAWAPNPIAIAYVVRRGARHELRVIEGDGDGDRLVDPDVAPVRPAWRADTQALAYAARGGVRIAAYPALSVRATLAAPRGVAALAYAPTGDRLAVAGAGAGGAVGVSAGGGPVAWTTIAPGSRLDALAWDGPGVLAVAGRGPGPEAPSRLWRVPAGTRAGKASGVAVGPPVAAMESLAPGRLAVAAADGPGLAVWEVAIPGIGEAPLRPRRILLRLPRSGGGVQGLSAR